MALQPDIQYVPFYYVDGSTARKAERRQAPAPQKAAAPTAAPKRRRSKRKTVAVDPVALCGLLVVAVMICAMVAGYAEYTASLERNAQMSAYIDTLQEENAQLQQQYEAGYDLDQIQSVADALGMIPAEDAQQISMDVQLPQQEEQVQLGFWESFTTFLAGLFA